MFLMCQRNDSILFLPFDNINEIILDGSTSAYPIKTRLCFHFPLHMKKCCVKTFSFK